MYFQAIAQCTRNLEAFEACLAKAERHAADKTFDVGILMDGRLVPDMKPLTYQVQSACDYLKAGAAWLSGQKPPRHDVPNGPPTTCGPASTRPWPSPGP